MRERRGDERAAHVGREEEAPRDAGSDEVSDHASLSTAHSTHPTPKSMRVVTARAPGTSHDTLIRIAAASAARRHSSAGN